MKTKNYLKTLSLAIIIFAGSSCSKEESKPASTPAPTADFIYTGANTQAPATVNFINSSTNSTSYSWDFGDNGSSTETNPQHTYNSGGVYTVKLTATGQGGTTSTIKTVNIGSAPTKVKITKLTISNIPFVDATGSSWDFSTGPDVFYNITDQTNTILASGSKINDVTTNLLPLTWNFTTPFEITDFNVSRFVDVWDFDTPDADDNIGYVGFIMNEYTSGSDPYPSSIIKTQNGITVQLNLTWQ